MNSISKRSLPARVAFARSHKNMLIVATGDGKGKTTSAIGQAIRAIGNGRRVFFAQFIKCDDFPSGEDEMLRHLGDKLTFVKGGKGFVGICGDKLPFSEHQGTAQKTLALAEEAVMSGAYTLVILDEVNVAVALKLLTVDDLLRFLDSVPSTCDVMFTGRHADPKIIKRADFVTNCVEVKHPFHKKVPAQKGIEY